MNEELKQQVLDKSKSLFMRYGIKSVTMDDIAREMGISKKTLYQVVENKSDLIERIFQCYIEEEKKDIDQICEEAGDAVEEMLRIADYVLRKLREMPPAAVYDLRKYYRGTWKQVEALHQRYIYQLIRDNLERGMAQGVYRGTLNPDIIAKVYVGKASLVTDEETFPLSDYNIAELFQQYIDYHIHGIASPRGLKLLEAHQSVEGSRSEQ